MPKGYDLDGKIARKLKEWHGIVAVVTNLNVRVGDFEEQLSGVISRDKLDALAERIKQATGVPH